MKLKWRQIVIAHDSGDSAIPETSINTEAESGSEFGWREPIVVDRGGVIVSGHTRLVAARGLGVAATKKSRRNK